METKVEMSMVLGVVWAAPENPLIELSNKSPLPRKGLNKPSHHTVLLLPRKWTSGKVYNIRLLIWDG